MRFAHFKTHHGLASAMRIARPAQAAGFTPYMIPFADAIADSSYEVIAHLCGSLISRGAHRRQELLDRELEVGTLA
jgi:hypothetical protein